MILDFSTPVYIVMVGLPGSGKTYARQRILDWIGRWYPSAADPYVASTDDYIDLAAEDYGITYDKAFDRFIKEAEASMKTGIEWAMQNSRHIIHDQTNLSEKKRRRILANVRNGYLKIACVVQVDEAMRQGRLQVRSQYGKTIPTSIDNSMRASMTLPTKEEGFDLIVTPNDFA